MIRRPPRSTHCISSAASDVYKRQGIYKVLFNPSYPVKLGQNNELEDDVKNKNCALRANAEAIFHKDFCLLLNYARDSSVNCELVVEILMLLFDIIDYDLYTLADNIIQLLDIYYKEYRLKEKVLEGSEKEWNVKEIVKGFKELNDVKCTVELYNYSKTLRTPKATEEHSCFKPTAEEFSRNPLGKSVSKHASQGAEEIKNAEARIISMYEKRKRTEEKLRLEREKQAAKELLGCTFRPTLEAKFSAGLYASTGRAHDPSAERARREEQKLKAEERECTFRPAINKRMVAREKHVPHDYDKEVNRLRAAKEYQQKMKFAKEHIPAGENYHKNKEMKPKPLCTAKNKKEKIAPEMYIDVTIQPGKSGRIAVKKGDDPMTLASNFAKTFGLNKDTRETLVTLVQNSMKEHFGETNSELTSNIA
eukprot:TRINITY_DN13968_c0_g1_i3.p1 TRINITY_DN13968_c0_g1~~TRINITY_DN13968_c0_g1_i3.p1  ORF type:complete len:428 (+),score=121.43 TRINITY_DN13968_c0_g1_i3:23-1285(+)